ncbi:MAG TPA: hypothetical protein ACFYEK_15635 [Candidatus Wunengus sp. YC60]|uniref:hypothetical protein n=1 Tax=Candidatus Wunengus sp. YC60 TaxID=3367697 RepID=UPI0040293CAA
MKRNIFVVLLFLVEVSICLVSGIANAADVEIILGASSAFNVVRGTDVSSGTKLLYVGSSTVSIGTTTQNAMLYVAGSSTSSSDTSLKVRNSSGTDTLSVRNDGAILIGTNTSTLNSALYVGSTTSGSLGTITAGFLSIGTISANTSLHGTTTVRFLNDIFSNGTITATKFSGDGSSLTGISVSGGVTGGNITTSGTISAGSTTVSVLTTTGSATVTGTVTAAGGLFTVNGNTGSMTAAVVNTATGNITTLTTTNATFGSLTTTTLTAIGSMTASSLALTGTLTAAATGGNVGIGTTTPATLLAVGTTTNILNVTSTGKVGVGTTTPSTALYVIGTMTASGEIISRNNGLVVKLEPPPMGEIYFTDNSTGNSTGTTITTIGSYVKAAGVTTFDPNSMFFGTSNTNNKLIYTGTSTKTFHVAMTASYSTNIGDTVGLAIAKNGTTTGMEKSIIKDYFPSSASVQSTAIHVMPVLNQNDYIEVFVTNLTSANTVTVKTLNMFAMGMSSGND